MRRAVLMLAGCAALPAGAAAQNKPCPVYVLIQRDGSLREGSPGYLLPRKLSTLREIVHNGCYPEGGPSPASGVAVTITSGAPAAKVQQVFDMLAQEGWPREKIKITQKR